ncbi:MAG: hypothetical protein NTW30_00960, partial [Candidatus Aenigmarchaeota archaeon]|nr:hypothetical protein [Candidatus Aenigmarchaeota archaeon]
MRKIPEEKKSGFGKIFGMFKGKEKVEPSSEEISARPIPGETEEKPPETPEEKKEEIVPEEPKEEVIEEEKSFKEIENEQEEKLEESEKIKKKEEEKELKEKYGVTKEIPKREIEEEYIETTKKTKELSEETDISELLLRLEKIDGKLEIFDNSKNEVSERTTQLAEEIGELRSMIMERERSFTKIESDFEKVKETVSGLEPARIKSAFEKRKMEILENKAKTEELEALVRALGEDVKKFRTTLEKIKSFENIADLSFDMDRKVAEVREVKDY